MNWLVQPTAGAGVLQDTCWVDPCNGGGFCFIRGDCYHCSIKKGHGGDCGINWWAVPTS